MGGVWQVGESIVLVRPTGGSGTRWALPGGVVRAGEALAESLVRTVADDTGSDALCGPFMGWGETVDAVDHVVTMYFQVVVLNPPEIDHRSGAMPPGPTGTEVRATPDWQVAELPVVPGLAEFLADQGLIELVI